MIALYILSSFWPLVIIFVIMAVVRRKRRRGGRKGGTELAVSREDAVSETFLLLSLFFLGVTLLSLNRDIGSPISFQTILLLTSIVGLALAYKLKIVYTLAISTMGTFIWFVLKMVEWTREQEVNTSGIITGIALVGLFLYLLGRFHEKVLKKIRFSSVYLVFGIIMVTFLLFILSSRLGLGMLEDTTGAGSIFKSWQVTTSLLIVLLIELGAAFFTAVRKIISAKELVAVIIFTVLFATIALLPEQDLLISGGFDFDTGAYESGSYTSSGVFWAVLFNILIFFHVLGLVFLGYVKREKWLINLGAAFLFMLIIVKYFDWFFTFLDKSIFFIGAGILLFFVGWLMEKGRRNILQNISTPKQQTEQILQP